MEAFLGPHKAEEDKVKCGRLVKVPLVLPLLAIPGARLKVCKVTRLTPAKEIICLRKKVKILTSLFRVKGTICFVSSDLALIVDTL